MPTYVVHLRDEALSAGQRADLARAITGLHAENTGAPKSFVQTMFVPLLDGGHFIGGEPADARSVWVYGHIRSGRSEQVRTALVEGIRDAVVDAAGIPAECVWVYLNELTHTDMIEFGAVLPAPGGEDAWVRGLPPAVRDHLLSLG